VPLRPGFNAWMFVGTVIVHDQMQIQASRSFAIYFLEETDKFLMSMTRHAISDRFAVEHTEGCKQGGRTIALVVAWGGVVCRVASTTALIFCAEIVGIRPGRGASFSKPAT